MKSGFVSESMVLGGSYLLATGNSAVGGTLLGVGILSGLFSFMYSVTLAQSAEKRRVEIFEITKGVITKLLQAVQDINVIAQKVDRNSIH